MKKLSLLLLALGLYLAGSAYAQSSAERGKLIDDARKEGKVVLYTGASAKDGNALKAAFEKKYPFIKMEYFRAGKDKLLGKYSTEARNNTFLADVYQGSVFPLATLQQRGLLARYRSPEWNAIHVSLRPKDDYWAPVVLNAMTIAYNTRLVKGDDIPKNYEDLVVQVERQARPRLNKTAWYVGGAEDYHRYSNEYHKYFR